MNGIDAGPPSGRATCQAHGLRYDPATQTGCVLCRRQSLAPVAEATTTQPAAAKSTARFPGWAYALAIPALLCLAIFAKMVMTVGQAISESERDSQQAGDRRKGTPYSSTDKAVTVWVPASWKSEKLDAHVEADLVLVSLKKDFGIIVVNEPAKDFHPTYSLGEYMALMREVYAKQGGFVQSIGATETLAIGASPALRAPFEGVNNGIRLRGNLYVMRGPSHFHQFMVFGVHSSFASKAAELERIVDGAEPH